MKSFPNCVLNKQVRTWRKLMNILKQYSTNSLIRNVYLACIVKYKKKCSVFDMKNLLIYDTKRWMWLTLRYMWWKQHNESKLIPLRTNPNRSFKSIARLTILAPHIEQVQCVCIIESDYKMFNQKRDESGSAVIPSV